jgi:hypothetical protein
MIEPCLDPFLTAEFMIRSRLALCVQDIEHGTVGQRVTPRVRVRRGIGYPQKVEQARDSHCATINFDPFCATHQIAEARRARRHLSDDQPSAGRQLIGTLSDLASLQVCDHGAHPTPARFSADLDCIAAEHEWPAMKGACHLSNHNCRQTCISQNLEHGHRIEATRRRQPAYTLDRLTIELCSYLRPPRAIRMCEMNIKRQPARSSGVLYILVRGQAIPTLPARDRRLLAPDPLSQLTLRELGAAACHQDEITTGHTDMVSKASTAATTKHLG